MEMNLSFAKIGTHEMNLCTALHFIANRNMYKISDLSLSVGGLSLSNTLTAAPARTGPFYTAGAFLEAAGAERPKFQLIFLYISNSHRRKGIASRLFSAASEVARERGAKRLYISATSSESTVNFYLSPGCKLAKDINKELQDLEPWDIQLIKE
jgi:GNAT superfamily N-acetyltransferase